MNTKTLALLAALAPHLVAQDSRPLAPRDAFTRARVIATQEHDPKTALAELEALLKRNDLDATLRRDVVAERDRLRAAIDPDPLATFPTERALAALAKLRDPDEAVRRSGVEDLVFFGEPAVKKILEHFPKEDPDREWTVRATTVLARIGSPRAANAIDLLVRDGDDFRRRAMLEGLVQGAKGILAKPVRASLENFFQLRDPNLAVLALQRLGQQVTPEQLTPLLDTREFGDGSSEVRAAAAENLVRRSPPGQEEENQAAYLPALARKLELGDSDVLQTLARLPWIQLRREGRALVLRALAGEQSMPVEGHYFLPPNAVEPDEAVDLTIAVVRALQSREAGVQRKRVAASFVRAHASRWTKAYVPQLCEATRFVEEVLPNEGANLVAHLLQIAEPEHAAELAKLALELRDAQQVRNWLGRQQRVGEDALPRIRALIEKALRAGGQPEGELFRLVATTGRETDLQYLESLRATYPKLCTWQVLMALQSTCAPECSPFVERVLVEVLGSELAGIANAASLREATFRTLALAGSKAALPVFAKAYASGLATPGNQMVAGRPRGLRWITQDLRYTPGELAKLGAELFALESAGPWNDLALAPSAERAKVPDLLLAALRQHAKCPPEIANAPSKADLLKSWLVEAGAAKWGPPNLEIAVLRGIVEANHLTAEVLRLWEEAAPQAARAFAESLLGSPQQHARRDAARFLVKVDPARGGKAIAALARDPSPAVRATYAELAGALADEARVPDLLALLRDPDEEVTKAATKALERIRLLAEHTMFWSRLQKGAGLDAPSAAEALVLEARPEKPKATRLLAIDSLGSLGVPETLPFLLGLTRDTDPEIAARATAAITKINGSAQRAK